MFRCFGSTSGRCSKASKMNSSKVKRTPQTPKGVKLSVLQNGYLRILIFLYFDPQNSKFCFFSKIKAHKIQHVGVIKKLYVVNLHTNNPQNKFHGNIFIFGCAVVKKPGNGYDVTFLKYYFWHF